MKSFSLINDFIIIQVILVIQSSKKWLDEATGFNKSLRNEGYAGILGVPIIGLRISGGKKYQVHTFRNGWLDEVTGNNISDFDFGFAGNYTNIDAVAISGVQRYQVHYLKGN